jgi:hypothetical protein
MYDRGKIQSRSWLWISLTGFLLFAGFFVGILYWGRSVQLSTPVYFILIVLVALFATAFLAGAMRSSARYTMTGNNKTLMMSGPAVIFFVILYIGYKYRPETAERPLSLSILVTGPGRFNDLIREGEVGIRIGELNYVKKISEEGIAYFPGIDADYKGRPLELFPRVAGYVLDAAGSYHLSTEDEQTNLVLTLKKATSRISIHGKVLQAGAQKGIGGAQVRFEGVDTSFVTDRSGNFYAVLPLESGTEVRVLVDKDDRVLYNSLRVVTDKALLTFPVND